MTRTLKTRALAGLLAGTLTACGDPLGSLSQADRYPNDRYPNGPFLGGSEPNRSISGGGGAPLVLLGSVSMNGGRTAWGAPFHVTFEQGRLTGFYDSAPAVMAPLQDATLDGWWADYSTYPETRTAVKLKIVGGDEHGYAVQYYKPCYSRGCTGTWNDLCGTETFATVTTTNRAVAIPGKWNYHWGHAGDGGPIASTTEFTFSCRSGAIAKCVEMGYQPWVSASRHTTCVRAMRADFCGNGVPLTNAGTVINVYDNSVQYDTADWGQEAQWKEDGARCVYYGRRETLVANGYLPGGTVVRDYMEAKCPSKLGDVVPRYLKNGQIEITHRCPDDWQPGTLLKTEASDL